MIFFLSIFIFLSSIKCDENECYSSSENCKSISISDKNKECCEYITAYYTSCTVFTSSKITQFEVNSTEIIYKEYYLFSIFNLGSSSLVTYTVEYDCPSQSFSFNYNPNFLVTDEQREIFGSENYCLRLYFNGLFGMDLYPEKHELEGYEKKLIQKSDCDNAVMIPGSEKYESCAYASYKFTLKSGTTKTLNTCILITKAAFTIKTIDLDKALFMEFLLYSKVDGEFFDNFEIEITDKDNNKLVYDHLKKNFKKDANDGDNKNTKTSSSKCFFIKESKIFSIIILLLYLF